MASVLNFPNEPLSGEFYFKTVGENFAPALGFVNRPVHPALRRQRQISFARFHGPRQFHYAPP